MRIVGILISITLLAACASRPSAPIVPEAQSVATQQTVFVGTTRARNDDGSFGIDRGDRLELLELQVSVPQNRKIGSVPGSAKATNPAKHFTIAKQSTFASSAAFEARLRQKVQSQGATGREVTIFVHGYNNTFSDAAFRLAQLDHDLNIPGESIAYSWPSRGSPLGYVYDNDSAIFARDGLQQLLETVRRSGGSKIFLVGHSRGAHLVMETLRQLEIKNAGWAARALSGVALISPDIDLDVFRSQARRIQKFPDPFLIIGSEKDRALRLSAGLTGETERLGNLSNISELKKLPVVFLDVTAFSEKNSIGHFVAGSSPALIALLNQPRRVDLDFLKGESSRQRQISRAIKVNLNPTER